MVSESLISFWDYCKRLVYIDRLLVFGRRDALQIQRSDDRTVPLCFENINCSFGSEKSSSSAGGESVFLQLSACKREDGGETSEVVS